MVEHRYRWITRWVSGQGYILLRRVPQNRRQADWDKVEAYTAVQQQKRVLGVIVYERSTNCNLYAYFASVHKRIQVQVNAFACSLLNEVCFYGKRYYICIVLLFINIFKKTLLLFFITSATTVSKTRTSIRTLNIC